jgi:hypothetical protein
MQRPCASTKRESVQISSLKGGQISARVLYLLSAEGAIGLK